MLVFLDTNILLDLLLEREPYCTPTAYLVSLADKGKIRLSISSLTVANANYTLSKRMGIGKARLLLQNVCVLCAVTSVDEQVIKKALFSKFEDTEDAIQYESALSARADVIITRNPKDFKHSELPTMDAQEFLTWYELNEKNN
ncbi:DNA-binding protein [Bacteroidia bacterium]|nr:DNA-binding protein [Bacteroidia bacterium]